MICTVFTTVGSDTRLVNNNFCPTNTLMILISRNVSSQLYAQRSHSETTNNSTKMIKNTEQNYCSHEKLNPVEH